MTDPPIDWDKVLSAARKVFNKQDSFFEDQCHSVLDIAEAMLRAYHDQLTASGLDALTQIIHDPRPYGPKRAEATPFENSLGDAIEKARMGFATAIGAVADSLPSETPGTPAAPPAVERWRRFNDTCGAVGYCTATGPTGANYHPDRCECQGDDPIPHKHYDEPPYSCARCTTCKAYKPAVPPEPTPGTAEHAAAHFDETFGSVPSFRDFPECTYCGCRTNARRRRCCKAGELADRMESDAIASRAELAERDRRIAEVERQLRDNLVEDARHHAAERRRAEIAEQQLAAAQKQVAALEQTANELRLLSDQHCDQRDEARRERDEARARADEMLPVFEAAQSMVRTICTDEAFAQLMAAVNGNPTPPEPEEKPHE